ncbi:hypothetical protein GA0116948_110131 [Chitinophaga costaii]|uniref:Uncharacterized protein n=1 Tax=Chitinophaga costaii TaxID=1335309 RepID=A0A1C4EYR2_9BACT|nr:hypothetical protein [Chitinophaga costaii]PUZ21537.1 hypothetical protein DCM91_15990 [Chitinophaga costaii]SCC48808.1 hypothetical protein GA0116948_110131 [Chitinophaga costaii]
MKWIIVSLLALGCSLPLHSVQAQQGPNFPSDSNLQTKADYDRYGPMVQQAADWLEATSLDDQRELRQATDRFIYRWVNGSPTVRVHVNNHLLKLMDKNQQLSMIYLARYAAWCLTNNDYQNAKPPTKAALQAIIKVYKKGINVKHTKLMDQLVSAADHNGLDDYISHTVLQ